MLLLWWNADEGWFSRHVEFGGRFVLKGRLATAFNEQPASTDSYREQNVGNRLRGWVMWSMDVGAVNPPGPEVLADKGSSTFGAPKNDEQWNERASIFLEGGVSQLIYTSTSGGGES